MGNVIMSFGRNENMYENMYAEVNNSCKKINNQLFSFLW